MQPQLAKTSYFGFSFGGHRHGEPREPVSEAAPAEAEGDLPRRSARRRARRLGRARARRLAGGHPADREARVPRPRRGRDLRAEPGRSGRKLQRGLPEAGTHPEAQQGPRAHHTDDHGRPTLSAIHGVCAAAAAGFGGPTPTTGTSAGRSGTRCADCAYCGTDCRYALGNTRRHRSNGRWSDGVAITPLKIQDAAPIQP